jgi:hypothetical protein
MYQVEPVVWTSITTSCDEVCSHNRQDLMQSLAPTHYMYVTSLSNISIKHFKQITRVELRLTNLYNSLGRLHFVHDATLFVAIHSFALFTLLTLTCFPRIPMIWHHDKIVRQKRSRVMLCHSFITTVWWYNILY